MRPSRISLFLALTALAFGGTTAAAAAGESFFPAAGTRAYDVLGYDVELDFQPERGGRVQATARVTAVANRRLGQLALDFFGPSVIQVRVDGRIARRERTARKLLVHLRDRTIQEGETFRVTVHYAGVPGAVTDPDGSHEGWVQTDDGVVAVGEPQGTAAWIPCNNVPWDKASFRFEISVPSELKAAANGRLRSVSRRDRRTTYTWTEAAPMSPYLAVLGIGRGELIKSRAGGRPSWTLVDPRLERAGRRVLRDLPEIIRFQRRLFGEYPFEAAGSILDRAPELGYALETQSRPIYTYAPSRTLVVHEVAHQWFGDSVGLERWPEIWLNEGFATWTQWYYAERHGGRSARQVFARLRRVPASNERFWNPPPGHPGSPRHLFDSTVYVRGAMAVQALRQKIGTETLLRVLRRWTSEHRHGNATIAEFVALAGEVSGQDLDRFFQRWLYQRGKPR